MPPKAKDKKLGKKKTSAPNRLPGSASKSSTSTRTQSSAIPANGFSTRADLPADLQQEILDIFPRAFSSLTRTANSNELKERIQGVKGALYDRDFEAAFSTIPNQQAYCLRWSPTRALAYADLVLSIPQLLDDLLGTSEKSWDVSSENKIHDRSDDPAPDKGERLVLSIGGGAGAEIVAVSAALKRYSQSQMFAKDEKRCADEGPYNDDDEGDRKGLPRAGNDRTSNRARSVLLKTVDIADWSHALKLLFDTLNPDEHETIQQDAVTSTKVATNKDTDASQNQNEQKTRLSRFEFINRDVLDMGKEELHILLTTESPQSPPLITIFFTLNELYSASMPKTTALLLKLTDLVPEGTQLLVVDSPGSYSTVGLNGRTEKKYPMQWLLDHTLLEATRRESTEGEVTRGERERMPAKWDKIGGEESRWWRMDRSTLTYDVPGIELENMRMQWHYYRRL